MIYLSHELVIFTKFFKKNDYKCIKCGIELFYEDNDKTFWIINNNGETSFELGANIDEHCNISCNEFLIKNIIE